MPMRMDVLDCWVRVNCPSDSDCRLFSLLLNSPSVLNHDMCHEILLITPTIYFRGSATILFLLEELFLLGELISFHVIPDLKRSDVIHLPLGVAYMMFKIMRPARCGIAIQQREVLFIAL